jgi:sorbitol-specific phosphotransferase system component IIC
MVNRSAYDARYDLIVCQRFSQSVFASFSLLSETFLFAYLGITAGVSFKPRMGLTLTPITVIFAIIAVVIARALYIQSFPSI